MLKIKRHILILLLLCLTLCSCTAQTNTTQPTVAPTQPPNLIDLAEPWDSDEALKRIRLPLLDTERDLSFGTLSDRLIFWQYEYSDDWISGLKLWSVDAQSGATLAQQSLHIEYDLQPQLQTDRICICDSYTGDIVILDRDLRILEQWHREPDWNHWFLGAGSRLYSIEEYSRLVFEDLESGENQIILERAAELNCTNLSAQGAALSFTDVDLGARQVAFLDFSEGLMRQPFRGDFTDCQYAHGQWLCVRYTDHREFRVGNASSAFDGHIESGLISLLPEGYLFEESSDGEHLYLYDTNGTYLTGCRHKTSTDHLSGVQLHWSETLNAYLFLLWNESTLQNELILWNLENTVEHQDLPFSQADLSVTPEQELEDLRLRAQGLEETYGLKIWLGKDCLTDFDDFTAVHLSTPELIDAQLDILERALSAYPEDFFNQLRYDSYQQIHIQLVSELTAKPHYGTGGSYGAFTQPKEGYYLVVINCDYAAEGTYYHEFSHIIDDYLQWDSIQREDSMYSEEKWLSLNPSDFDYTYDYAVVQSFRADWDQYFIDEYAMIRPTEDRARIMEYAMAEYTDWRFDEAPGLREKLRYYCACIRDAFDTSSWPKELLWEQHIKEG